MKPLTAQEIVEYNRVYWSPGGRGWLHVQRANETLEKLTHTFTARVQDIIAGRVRDGWPTREFAAFEECG